MPDRHVEHVLIGGGIASASAATTLRECGAQGAVLLVGRELDPPYHRPPASKGYLQGRESREDTLLPIPDDVEVVTRTSVLALDVEQRTAHSDAVDEGDRELRHRARRHGRDGVRCLLTIIVVDVEGADPLLRWPCTGGHPRVSPAAVGLTAST